MKAKGGVVDLLNRILSAHLAAISQYFLHAKLCEYWGYERLHRKLRGRSIDGMKAADTLIGHILYLEAGPRVQGLSRWQPGDTVTAQIKSALQAEQELLALLREGVRHCATVEDFTTRHLLEDMAKKVDAQIDWIETQLTSMAELGLEPYLAEQLTESR